MSERFELHRVGLRAFLDLLRDEPDATVHGDVVAYLASRRGHIVRTREIIDWLYRDRSDGGPLYAEECVLHAIARLRREGVPIVTHVRNGYALGAT